MRHNNARAVADEIEILRVPAWLVAEDYEIYKPFIEASLEYETEAVDAVEIFHKLRSNQWLCVIVMVAGKLAGLCICEQRKKRKGFALEIMMLSGDGLRWWKDALFTELKVIALAHNCNALTLCGRLGWLPVLKGYGFKPVSQSLRLEL